MKKYILIEAKPEDCKLLFEWVNEVEVRKNSKNTTLITWENHKIWFNKKLSSQDSLIYLLTDGENKIGQVRIDYDVNEDKWDIDYSIESQFRNNGFGTLIIGLLLNKHNNFSFRAVIKRENISSINVFVKLGFINKPYLDHLYLCYER